MSVGPGLSSRKKERILNKRKRIRVHISPLKKKCASPKEEEQDKKC